MCPQLISVATMRRLLTYCWLWGRATRSERKRIKALISSTLNVGGGDWQGRRWLIIPRLSHRQFSRALPRIGYRSRSHVHRDTPTSLAQVEGFRKHFERLVIGIAGNQHAARRVREKRVIARDACCLLSIVASWLNFHQ